MGANEHFSISQVSILTSEASSVFDTTKPLMSTAPLCHLRVELR